MLIVAYIVFGFSCLQLAIALVNFALRDTMKMESASEALISVLIPARNEEKSIGNLLSDLEKQNHPSMEVIICDDQSEDSTATVVSTFTAQNKNFRLIFSGELPEEWLGKNYACHLLAQEARGDYFLFLDADVRIGSNVLSRTLAYAERKRTELVSLFPVQEIKTPGEWAVVPLMNYILLSLLPLFLVRTSGFTSLSAANGQFMFFNARSYRKYLPHLKMKNKKAEDIATARYFKREKVTISCLAADPGIKCRMYGNFSEAINGFSKNLISFFGNSYLVAFLFWLITSVGIVSIFFYLPWLVIPFISIALVKRILISVTSHQSVVKNLAFLPLQQFSLGVVILKSVRNYFKKEFVWKGRNIS